MTVREALAVDAETIAREVCVHEIASLMDDLVMVEQQPLEYSDDEWRAAEMLLQELVSLVPEAEMIAHGEMA